MVRNPPTSNSVYYLNVSFQITLLISIFQLEVHSLHSPYQAAFDAFRAIDEDVM